MTLAVTIASRGGIINQLLSASDRDTHLRLRLLGPAQVALGEPPAPVDLAGQKGAALAFYLASRPDQPATRTRLVALLWEESDEQEGRNSLSTTLSRLRRSLPSVPIAMAEAARVLVLLGRAHGWLAEIELARSEFEAARRLADVGLGLSQQHGYLYDASLCERALGQALVAMGQVREGREHLAGARDGFTAIGAQPELASDCPTHTPRMRSRNWPRPRAASNCGTWWTRCRRARRT